MPGRQETCRTIPWTKVVGRSQMLVLVLSLQDCYVEVDLVCALLIIALLIERCQEWLFNQSCGAR
jgi:hypothetical protein